VKKNISLRCLRLCKTLDNSQQSLLKNTMSSLRRELYYAMAANKLESCSVDSDLHTLLAHAYLEHKPFEHWLKPEGQLEHGAPFVNNVADCMFPP